MASTNQAKCLTSMPFKRETIKCSKGCLSSCVLDEQLSKFSYEKQMVACTALQSKTSNLFKCSLFQHLQSVNNANIMPNTELSHCPQGAYGLRKHMSGQEVTTKEYNNFSFEKPWKHMSEGICELSLKRCKG